MARIALLAFLLLAAACGPQRYGTSGAVDGPPPPMPAGANLARWDYYCVESTIVTAKLIGQAGEQGWELVGQAGPRVYCFKRPHVEPAAPAAPAGPPAAEPEPAPAS